jgi:NADH-quinone oxidoreductase subunit N
MAVLMLALMGFPIFGGAGFYAKWYVLQAALNAPVRQTTLAVVLVLTTVISAGYYLYVVMLMFMRPRPEGLPAPEQAGGLTRVVLNVTVALLLIFGFVPERAIEVARSGQPVFGPAAGTTASTLPNVIDFGPPRSPPERVVFVKGPPQVKYDSAVAR